MGIVDGLFTTLTATYMPLTLLFCQARAAWHCRHIAARNQKHVDAKREARGVEFENICVWQIQGRMALDPWPLKQRTAGNSSSISTISVTARSGYSAVPVR